MNLLDSRAETHPISILPEPHDPWKISSGLLFDRGIPTRAHFLRAPDAPEETIDLLRHAPTDGTELYRTTQCQVIKSGEFVLKTNRDSMALERHDRIMGRAALAINLALQVGLDDTSILESGYRVTAPRYYGVLLMPSLRAAKWVMSYEHGEAVNESNRAAISTQPDRRAVYDVALRAAGLNPGSAWYDDGEYNLIVRPEEKVVVKLDALSAASHAELLGEPYVGP